MGSCGCYTFLAHVSQTLLNLQVGLALDILFFAKNLYNIQQISSAIKTSIWLLSQYINNLNIVTLILIQEYSNFLCGETLVCASQMLINFFKARLFYVTFNKFVQYFKPLGLLADGPSLMSRTKERRLSPSAHRLKVTCIQLWTKDQSRSFGPRALVFGLRSLVLCLCKYLVGRYTVSKKSFRSFIGML